MSNSKSREDCAKRILSHHAHPMPSAWVAFLQLVVIVALSVGALMIYSSSARASTQAAGTYEPTPYKPVGLGDAERPPTYLVYLYPHGSVTYASGRDGWNCIKHGDVTHDGYFTDVSAYSWRGRAIGPQRWDENGKYSSSGAPSDYWYVRDHHAGKVTFDGITFENHSRVPVLVAGWCE